MYQLATERYGRHGSHQFLQPVESAEALSNAEVIDGQHVESAQAKHQHHLHCPPADAAHFDQSLDDGLFVERVKRLRRWFSMRQGPARLMRPLSFGSSALSFFSAARSCLANATSAG